MPLIYAQTTPDGHKFGEAVSAMQKSIRRGLVAEANYWAFEIHLCDNQQSRSHLWNRLKVTCSEDIGPTPEGNQIVLLLGELERSYLDAVRRKNKSQWLFLTHAVTAMCRAPKSRVVDLIAYSIMHDDNGGYDVPDWAVDMHTQRGRSMGRGFDEWWGEGSLIERPASAHDAELKTLEDHFLAEAKECAEKGTPPRQKLTPTKRTAPAGTEPSGDNRQLAL